MELASKGSGGLHSRMREQHNQSHRIMVNNISKHLYSVYSMPGMVPSTLYMLTHLYAQQPDEAGTVIIPFYR